MEMFGLNALETNKMDVCGFGGQQPADITSYMYLPTQPNGKGLDATSSANLIPGLSDNYLPQVYDPVGATDILTAAVQEIQYTDEKSQKITTENTGSKGKSNTPMETEEDQHPIDIQKRHAWKIKPTETSTKKNRKKRKVESLQKDRSKLPTEMKSHLTLNLSRTKLIYIFEAEDIVQIQMVQKDQSSLSLGEMKTLFKSKEKLIDSVLEVIIADAHNKKKTKLHG